MDKSLENRRRSKLRRWTAGTVAQAWKAKNASFLLLLYLAVLAALFFGKGFFDPTYFLESSRVFDKPDTPLWEAPSSNHWFGRNAGGHDLLELSRVGIAWSLAFAAVCSLLGVMLAMVFATLIALGSSVDRFRLLDRLTGNAVFLPAFLLVMLIAAGSNGNIIFVMIAVILCVGVTFPALIGQWYEQCEEGGDVIAGLSLGMSRYSLIAKHAFPLVLRKSAGLIAGLIPILMTVEMSLSFLGFLGDSLSCGNLVAAGRENLLEAPWLVIYPGLLATVAILIFAFLGWLVGRAGRTEVFPRLF